MLSEEVERHGKESSVVNLNPHLHLKVMKCKRERKSVLATLVIHSALVCKTQLKRKAEPRTKASQVLKSSRFCFTLISTNYFLHWKKFSQHQNYRELKCVISLQGDLSCSINTLQFPIGINLYYRLHSRLLFCHRVVRAPLVFLKER